MKFYRLTLLCAIVLAVVAFGCRPDNVEPSENSAPEIGALVDTLHTVPSPACTTVKTIPLVSTDPIFTQPFGNCQVVNDLDNVVVVFDAIPGLSVAQAALWWKVGGCDPAGVSGPPCNVPTDIAGNWDPTKFPRWINVNPVRSPYAISQYLGTLFQCNTFAGWANLVSLDVNGNPIFSEGVWVAGKADPNGAFLFDFCSGRCPEHDCDPWLDSPQSCFGGTPPCTYPSPGPGDDLSAYACGNGNGSAKVTVCHLPPGNPENVQEICISVNALPAHIVDFKPATNRCMGHHSGCHIGPCDPCPNGDATGDSRAAAKAFYDNWGCTGSSY